MLHSFSPNKSLGLVLIAAGAFATPQLSFGQATITWDPVQDTTGPNDIAPGGAVVEARNGLQNVDYLSDNPALDVTIGGVMFDATNFFGRNLAALGTNGFLEGKTTGNADYDTLIGNATGSDGTVGASGTLTNVNYEIVGLTSGVTYQVQVWHSDLRAVADTRTMTVDSTNLLDSGQSGDPNDFGQFVVGTFTASGSTQILNFNCDGGQANRTFVSAIVVRVDTGGTLSNYCGPAVTNTSGGSASITATGSVVVSNNDVTLATTNMPVNSFGFFLVSSTQGFVANPGGSAGNLCLGGGIGRYVGPGQVQNTGSAGAVSLLIDLTSLPQPNGTAMVAAGDVWNFQTWFRDSSSTGTPTSNFSNGLQITFE